MAILASFNVSSGSGAQGNWAAAPAPQSATALWGFGNTALSVPVAAFQNPKAKFLVMTYASIWGYVQQVATGQQFSYPVSCDFQLGQSKGDTVNCNFLTGTPVMGSGATVADIWFPPGNAFQGRTPIANLPIINSGSMAVQMSMNMMTTQAFVVADQVFYMWLFSFEIVTCL